MFLLHSFLTYAQFLTGTTKMLYAALIENA